MPELSRDHVPASFGPWASLSSVPRAGSEFPSFPQREIEMCAEKMEEFFAELMPLTYAAFNANGRVAP